MRPRVARMLKGMKRFGAFNVTDYRLIRNPSLNVFAKNQALSQQLFPNPHDILDLGPCRLWWPGPDHAPCRDSKPPPFGECRRVRQPLLGSGDSQWNSTRCPALAGLTILAQDEICENSLWNTGENVKLTKGIRFCRIIVEGEGIFPGELKKSLHKRQKGTLQNGQDYNKQ